jgi:hypothetical protein
VIAGRNTEIIEFFRGVNQEQLAESGALQIAGDPPAMLTVKELFGFFAAEALYHNGMIAGCVNIVKRYYGSRW